MASDLLEKSLARGGANEGGEEPQSAELAELGVDMTYMVEKGLTQPG